MATRITVVKNQNDKFQGWMCKHSSHTVQPPSCNCHVTLCERCDSAVKNGAELLSDDYQQRVEPVKIAVVGIAKRAAAAGR